MFYTTEKLSARLSLTNEGFLVCHDVPIARTGKQLYSTEEVPIESKDGIVEISRAPEDVFDEVTIASFEGKPVTIDHPSDFVSPENWKELAVGTTQNVRRGEGNQADLLIADLLVTDKEAINAILHEGLREVSCGYESSYEQTALGKGRQFDIVGNHVALVERGRAGSRCAIKDKQGVNMAKKSFKDRLLAAFRANDEESIERLAEEVGNDSPSAEGSHIHLHLNSGQNAVQTDSAEGEGGEGSEGGEGDDNSVDARLSRIEAAIASLMEAKTGDSEEDDDAEEMAEGEGEEGEEFTDGDDEDEEGEGEEQFADTLIEAETAGKADVGKTFDGYKRVVARAEIIAAGMSFPTADAAKGKGVLDTIKRKALAKAMTTDSGKKVIAPLLMGKPLKALTGDALNAVFVGASELMRERNNANGIRMGVTTKDFGRTSAVSEINARNKAFWANRK